MANPFTQSIDWRSYYSSKASQSKQTSSPNPYTQSYNPYSSSLGRLTTSTPTSNSGGLSGLLGSLSTALQGLYNTLGQLSTHLTPSSSTPGSASSSVDTGATGGYTGISNPANYYSRSTAPVNTPSVSNAGSNLFTVTSHKSYGGGMPVYSTGGSVSNYNSTPAFTPSYISKPVSGLVSVIETPEEKKKKLNESALEQKKQLTASMVTVPTRKSVLSSFLEGVKKFFALPAKELPEGTPPYPPTGTTTTTTKPTPIQPTTETAPIQDFSKFISTQNIPSKEITYGMTGISTAPEHRIETKFYEETPKTQPALPVISKPNLAPELYQDSQDSIQTIKQMYSTYQQLIDKVAQYNQLLAQKEQEPQRTPEKAAQIYQEIVQHAQAMYPQIDKIQSKIDVIDKALADAMAGFRRSAEAIRNNPDLSFWQQKRRLAALEDLQNYAPIFGGLSLRDLINYRNQLAQNLNYYTGLFNNAIKGIANLTDLSSETERMAKSAKYLTNVVNLTGEEIKSLAGLLIPTYGFDTQVNNKTGEVTWIIYKIDPVTKFATPIGKYSWGNIGNRTITSANAWQQLFGNTGTSETPVFAPNLPTSFEQLPTE